MSWFGWGRSDAEEAEAREKQEVAELKEMLKRPADLVPKGEYVRLEVAQHNRRKAAEMRKFKDESQRMIEQNKQEEIRRKKEIVEGVGGEVEREREAKAAVMRANMEHARAVMEEKAERRRLIEESRTAILEEKRRMVMNGDRFNGHDDRLDALEKARANAAAAEARADRLVRQAQYEEARQADLQVKVESRNDVRTIDARVAAAEEDLLRLKQAQAASRRAESEANREARQAKHERRAGRTRQLQEEDRARRERIGQLRDDMVQQKSESRAAQDAAEEGAVHEERARVKMENTRRARAVYRGKYVERQSADRLHDARTFRRLYEQRGAPQPRRGSLAEHRRRVQTAGPKVDGQTPDRMVAMMAAKKLGRASS